MLELACLFLVQKTRCIIFPQLNTLLPTYVEQHENTRTINSCLPSAAIYTLTLACLLLAQLAIYKTSQKLFVYNEQQTHSKMPT